MRTQNRNPINLVVALPAEAKPLINKMNLQRDQRNKRLPLYTGDGICLIITGPGASASAQGVHALQSLRPYAGTQWINVGICGHGSLDVGTPLLIDHIIDGQSGEKWSLLIPHPPTNRVGSLTCVHEAQSEYATDMAYDMESSGFIEAVGTIHGSSCATLLKIVSDNPRNDTCRISGKFVEMLVQQHVGLIQSLIDQLMHLGQVPLAASNRYPMGPLADDKHS